MAQFHLKFEAEDLAPHVMLVGNPQRAEQVSKLLQGVRLVNDYRYLLVFTGIYEGERLSVATTGMGAPQQQSSWRSCATLARVCLSGSARPVALRRMLTPATLSLPRGVSVTMERRPSTFHCRSQQCRMPTSFALPWKQPGMLFRRRNTESSSAVTHSTATTTRTR